MPRVRSLAVLAGLVLAATSLAPCPSTAVSAAVSDPGRSTLSDLEARFLTTRPPVGPTWVVSIAGESTGRSLTARSLQGLVNATSARTYLIDGGDGGAQALFDRYVDRGLVVQAGTTNLDGMLDLFAGDAAGYVLADPAEPWSVHGAAVIASLQGGIIATVDQVASLQGRGLTELDDTRGRWPDAPTAYAALAATYGDQLPSSTLAVVRPTDSLWDFVVQQGILPIFTRPGDPSWSAVRPMFDAVPDGSPVYGYLSDTGEEEAIAVATLASTDLVLVPTDTTRNLSFHIAVGADQPRVKATTTDPTDVSPCTTDELNVVIGLTDGDNMNVPLNHFLRPSNWDSTRRGDLPLGWSVGPDLAVLAPAAWDGYALEASAADELVAMIGWGYGAPALLSDPGAFYATSFELMGELGLRTFWSLGGGLETPLAGYWADVDAAADAAGTPDGVLIGYGNATGDAFYSPGGRPALTSRSVYSETPADLAQHVTDLLATPTDQRPLVSFLSATNWSNPAGDLIDALAPFEAQGVRFLTPSEASACMPPAPDAPPARDPLGACGPQDPIHEHGLELISSPIATEIATTPTVLPTGISVVATEHVGGGEVIEHEATIAIDLPTFAADTLRDRVQPIVEAGYGPELAATTWLELDLRDLWFDLWLQGGEQPSGTPTVTSTGPTATASWGAEGPSVRIGRIEEDSRSPGDPFELTLQWSTIAPERPEASVVPVIAPAARFALDLTVGVVLGDLPLQGGANARWGCSTSGATLARTRVDASDVAPVVPAEPITATPAFTG